MSQTFYNDFLYKKLKPKSDILETLLESNEQRLIKINEIPSLYNVSIPTQDDIWICGRVFSENAGGGGGKLTEHNVALQGSYVCSNSHSVSLNLTNCNECSLFPGQIVLVNGRNPDGKRFLCKEIIEPPYISENAQNFIIKKEITGDIRDMYTRDNSINVNSDANEEIQIIVASGPFMQTGSVQTPIISQLVEVVMAKNAQVLIMLGPFVDSNHDLVSAGNLQNTYEELLQTIFDEIAQNLRQTKVQVIIQPSLTDVTQEPIYPVAPFHVSNQFIKQNEFFHFLQEPSMIEINGIKIAITTTDVIKDLTSIAISKTQSSDKISRNFSHMLRQRLFYPIYPPPDNICIDFEAWAKHARIDVHPRIFIAVSDLVTFNKEVNNCTCFNPGRLIKGTSNGTYAHVSISPHKPGDNQNQTPTQTLKSQSPYNVSVTFNKI